MAFKALLLGAFLLTASATSDAPSSTINLVYRPKPATPSSCNANETYVECSSSCSDRQCINRQGPELMCPPVCEPPACQCSQGFARTPAGRCVAMADCPPTPQCKTGETINLCPGACNEEKCGDNGQVNCKAKKECPPPGCVCAHPLVRNGTGGGCIERSKCPSTL